MRKTLIALFATGTLLTAGMIPVGVKVLADTASTAPAETFTTHRPLFNFIRGQIGRFMTLRSELDLTDAQKAQIKTLLQSHKTEIVAAIKPLVEKRRALRDAVLATPSDEKTIRAASDDLGHAIGDAAVLASKLKQEAAGILTDDQVQKIADFRAQSGKAVDEFFQKMADQQK